MRDAFGGVFMIRLFLVFILIYISITALALNYARAFKIKNSVISFLEENQVTSLSPSGIEPKLSKLDEILDKASYNKTCNRGNGSIISTEGKYTGYCYRGVVISILSETNVTGTSATIIRYQVLTYADWNLGNINKMLSTLTGSNSGTENQVSGTFEIKGEAKVIAHG